MHRDSLVVVEVNSDWIDCRARSGERILINRFDICAVKEILGDPMSCDVYMSSGICFSLFDCQPDDILSKVPLYSRARQ